MAKPLQGKREQPHVVRSIPGKCKRRAGGKPRSGRRRAVAIETTALNRTSTVALLSEAQPLRTTLKIGPTDLSLSRGVACGESCRGQNRQKEGCTRTHQKLTTSLARRTKPSTGRGHNFDRNQDWSTVGSTRLQAWSVFSNQKAMRCSPATVCRYLSHPFLHSSVGRATSTRCSTAPLLRLAMLHKTAYLNKLESQSACKRMT